MSWVLEAELMLTWFLSEFQPSRTPSAIAEPCLLASSAPFLISLPASLVACLNSDAALAASSRVWFVSCLLQPARPSRHSAMAHNNFIYFSSRLYLVGVHTRRCELP